MLNKKGSPSSFSMLELILVIAMLAMLTTGVWLALKNFLSGRTVETAAENLSNLIRTAQVSAKETESCQMILFTESEAIWKRYPGKTKEEIENKLASAEAEVVRRQVFKNEVIIEELSLKGSPVEVPEIPIANIGIIIDEKGIADSANILLANENENIYVSVGGAIVTSGSVGVLEFYGEGMETPQTNTNENQLIVQTEPLQLRGWQVLTINNVDKVKEVKLRVKLDARLPSSAHIHAYVFPGWYENKPVAHGVTGQQTMLDKMGTVPDFGDCPHFLYRESTKDCLYADRIKISGTVKKENGFGMEDFTLVLSTLHVSQFGQWREVATIGIDNNGYYEFDNIPTDFTYKVYPHSDMVNPFDWQPWQGYFHTLPSEDLTDDFIAYRSTEFVIDGTVSGTGKDNVIINISHLNGTPPGFQDNFMFNERLFTDENGYYRFEQGEGGEEARADHYYEIKPFKAGFTFVPSSYTVFLDDNVTRNFITASSQGNQFTDNKSPLGSWNYTETAIQNASALANIPVFSLLPTTLMQFHSGTQTMPMYNDIHFNDLRSINTPINTLNPGELSDFATENGSLEYYGDDYYELYDIVNNVHFWKDGYVYSSFASQRLHTITEKEAIQTGWTDWITIPVNTLPSQTKFLRIAIAIYHQTASGGEQLFNLTPTISSRNPNQATISVSNFDYETDPFIVYYPWANLVNDPFWLSHYAYAMKPMLRSYGVNVLASKGPVTGENYNNTGNSYKGFWYGPLYLDWDLILGNENLYWLLGWTTGTFELTKDRWRFTQQGDSYGNTAYAPPSHYLLKNFVYLSYWYLFQYADYNSTVDGMPKSLQDNSAKTSLRFQQPLNLRTENTGTIFSLFERPDPNNSPFNIPQESSNLSIPLLTNPRYPMWLSNLPAVFGQAKLTSSPDLYSSYYYLQEKINHTMLDIGVWTFLTSNNSSQKDTVRNNILSLITSIGGVNWLVRHSLGNFEVWTVGGDGMAAWWQWYQNIPWAKGQAFPKKTGVLPENFTERIGWERPYISQPTDYNTYFSSPQNYRDNSTTSYNAVQVVNVPHTIFMSTSHYPLGIIQVGVKRK